jgi:hypothetical protein
MGQFVKGPPATYVFLALVDTCKAISQQIIKKLKPDGRRMMVFGSRKEKSPPISFRVSNVIDIFDKSAINN